ncbi:hypothetical protein cypCar_00049333, partial [Cyprinus carpio]
MLLASVIWFVIEGSLYETVSCCMLYVLGPLRLFWVKPLTTDKILKSIMISHTDHAAFMAVMYSVLLAEHFPNVSTVFTSFSFGLLVLMCLLFITQLAKENVLSCSGESSKRMFSKVQQFVATCGLSGLPSLQLGLLLYTHFASGAVFIITAPPVLHLVSYIFYNATKCANQRSDAGPVCVAGFVQAL